MTRTNTAGKRSLRWGFTLLLFFISSVRVLAQTCVQPPQDIVAWWPFDETSGTTALDIAGGNNGTYVGAPQAASGIVSGSLQFDGSSTYVVVPDSDLWAFGTSDFTLEFWANFDIPAHGSLGHPGDVFLSNDNGPFNVDKWIFALSSTDLEFIVGETATGNGIFAPVVPFAPEVGRWYHLALTRSGTTYKVYVDGVQVGSPGTNLSVIPNPASPLTIGAALEPLGSGMGFGGVMSGRLDEVTVYHRQLTESELAAIVAAGSAGKCKELTIVTRSVPPVRLGDPASYQLKAQHGTPPYSWSLSDGTLPPGMALSSDGLLNGTPTEPGSFPFTVKVTDDNGDTEEKAFIQDIVLIPPPPKVRVHKTGTLAVPGRILDYFITVENVGDIAATDIEIHELLNPDHFSLLSADPEPEVDIQTLADASMIIWTIPILAPGEVKLLTYRVRLDPLIPLGTDIVGPAYNIKDIVKFALCFGGAIITSGVCTSCAAPCGAAVGTCEISPLTCPALIRQCVICAARCLGGLYSLGHLSKCYDDPPGSGADHHQPASGPIDPNEKVVVAKKCSRDPDDGTITCFIQPDQLLVYPIHFENISDDVEAIDVFVTDVLDPNLDTSTLSILTPNGASFDLATRTVRWDLLGRNLQPHETDNVLLSVRPLPGLPSGTEIRNKARIQFEVFDPLDTNKVVNVIDSTKPTCTMNPLPTQTPTLEFPISWSGADAVGEIDTYAVLVSVDGGAFTSLLEKTSDTSTTFTGEPGKTYAFLCVATDTAGNIEVQDPVAEATTTLIPLADLTLKRGTLLLDPDPDEDKLTLQGTFAGSAASINPPTEGVKITLTDADGQIVTLDFPAGALWKTNRGPRWTFKDPIAGKTLTLQFSAKTGTFSLRVNVRKVNLNDADPGAITTSVLIGDNLFQNVREWRSTAKGTKLVTP